MEHRNIIYGGSLPYRHMCRFQSGFFWRQELLDDYDWYWRVVKNPFFHPFLVSLSAFFEVILVLTSRNPGRIIIAILIMTCLSLWS
jgi:hypothetical protein